MSFLARFIAELKCSSGGCQPKAKLANFFFFFFPKKEEKKKNQLGTKPLVITRLTPCQNMPTHHHHRRASSRFRPDLNHGQLLKHASVSPCGADGRLRCCGRSHFCGDSNSRAERRLSHHTGHGRQRRRRRWCGGTNGGSGSKGDQSHGQKYKTALQRLSSALLASTPTATLWPWVFAAAPARPRTTQRRTCIKLQANPLITTTLPHKVDEGRRRHSHSTARPA